MEVDEAADKRAREATSTETVGPTTWSCDGDNPVYRTWLFSMEVKGRCSVSLGLERVASPSFPISHEYSR